MLTCTIHLYATLTNIHFFIQYVQTFGHKHIGLPIIAEENKGHYISVCQKIYIKYWWQMTINHIEKL